MMLCRGMFAQMIKYLTELMALEQWWRYFGVDLLLLAVMFFPTRYLVLRWTASIQKQNVSAAELPADAAWVRRVFWFLARGELWTLFLFIPLFLAPDSRSTYLIVGIGFLVAWLIRRLGRGVWTLPSPFDGLAIGLIILSGLSFLLHDRWDVSFPYLFRFWSGLGFLYFILNWTDTPGRAKFLAYSIGWYGVLFALAFPWLLFRSNRANLFLETHAFFPQLPAPLLKPPINANTYADILLLTVPFLFFVLSDMWSKKRWSAYLCWTALFLGFLWENLVFVVADSRFAYVVLVFLVVSWLLVIYWHRLADFARIMCVLTLTGAIVFLMGYFHLWQFFGIDILSVHGGQIFLRDDGLRSIVRKTGVPLFSLLPYWGFGANIYVISPLLGLVNLIHRFLYPLFSGHGWALRRVGIPALFLITVVFLSVGLFVYIAWKRFRAERDLTLAWLVLLLFFAIPFLLLYGLTDFAAWFHRGAAFRQFFPKVAVDGLRQVVLFAEWFLESSDWLWIGSRIFYLLVLFVVSGWLWLSYRRWWAKIIGGIGILLTALSVTIWLKQTHVLGQIYSILAIIQNSHLLWYHTIDARLMIQKIGIIVFVVTPYLGLGPNIYSVMPLFWVMGHYRSLVILICQPLLSSFLVTVLSFLLLFATFVTVGALWTFWTRRRFLRKVKLSLFTMILLGLLVLAALSLSHAMFTTSWSQRFVFLAALFPSWITFRNGFADLIVHWLELSAVYNSWLILFFAFLAQNAAFIWVYSRLAYLFSLLVFGWWLLRASRRRMPPIICLALLVVGSVLLGIWYPWSDHHIYLFFHGIELRMSIWRIGLELLLLTPFLGLGPNLYSTLLLSISDPGGIGHGTLMHAHNVYLQIALDFGFPALLLLLAIFLGTLILAYFSWRRFRARGDLSLANLSLAVLLAMLAFLSHGLVDIAGWQQRVTMFIWFFPGLAVALYRLSWPTPRR